jgi:site-specific DNA-methyltransferase (adenine-specific)
MPSDSVDSIVTDPPYELGFMGKKWDSSGIAYDQTLWAECLRVLKPGGHLIAFGGTRTYHRMTCAIEDVGFEIRDCIQWIYGSGFPKSLDVSKALDKQAGATREVVGSKHGANLLKSNAFADRAINGHNPNVAITAPATPEAQQWHGFGTALKPANEPAVLARKPLSGTVADNVLTWGCGALNIDGCRVEYDGKPPTGSGSDNNLVYGHRKGNGGNETSPLGRWPANVILDEEAAQMLDAQSGHSVSKDNVRRNQGTDSVARGKFVPTVTHGHSDSGGASRFFYVAKASKAEREAGLDCICTVKYNVDRSILGGLSWKDVSTVVVQLLEKVTSELAMLKWHIDESGENITAQYPSDSSFITLMEISKTTALKTCNLLMHLLTNESTADANFEMGNGSSHVKSAESLRAWILNTTNGRMELALGVVNVVLTTLSQINEKEPQQRNNSHSTVKPITLMRYLVRLVTPPGGTVLDPFMGSGSTGCAAMLEAMQFIGIELSAEYLEIARKRIEFHEYTVREKNPMGL